MTTKQKVKSIWNIIFRPKDNNVPQSYFSGDDENYMVDFRADRWGAPAAVGVELPLTSADVVKVSVKPRDVLIELGLRPSNWSLDGLDAKIAMMKAKAALITQKYSKDEADGLVSCLINRRQYDRPCKAAEGKTYREWFSQFDATDQNHIDALLKRHELVMQPADIFIPEFPDEAVKSMSDCTKVTEELCSKKPRLFVIASKDQFRDAYGKRDPILLIQSPFGFYYYILGAWDEEMLFLPEL